MSTSTFDTIDPDTLAPIIGGTALPPQFPLPPGCPPAPGPQLPGPQFPPQLPGPRDPFPNPIGPRSGVDQFR